MADEPQKVIVQSSRLDDHILPSNFTLAYRLYVIQQGADLKGIADASNSANDMAYQATLKNIEQDKTLADHSVRIRLTETSIESQGARLTNAEKALVSLDGRLSVAANDIDYLESQVSAANTAISGLQTDAVSKSATSPQSLSSSLNITTAFSINGTKVLGGRNLGWTAATGTAQKGGFNADQAYTIGGTYNASEMQALRDGVTQARQRIKALEDALRSHGLIN